MNHFIWVIPEPTSYIIAGLYPVLHFFILWITFNIFNFVRTLSNKIIDYISQFINLPLTRILVVVVVGIGSLVYLKSYIDWLLDDMTRLYTTMFYGGCIIVLAIASTSWETSESSDPPFTRLSKFIHSVVNYIENPLLIISASRKNHSSFVSVVLVLVLIVYIFFISLAYGSQLFATIPISYNGGRPTNIRLVFESDQLPDSLGIGMTNTSQSDDLCLLALLDSEILIVSGDRHNSWLVPRSSVVGIIDRNNPTEC